MGNQGKFIPRSQVNPIEAEEAGEATAGIRCPKGPRPGWRWPVAVPTAWATGRMDKLWLLGLPSRCPKARCCKSRAPQTPGGELTIPSCSDLSLRWTYSCLTLLLGRVSSPFPSSWAVSLPTSALFGFVLKHLDSQLKWLKVTVCSRTASPSNARWVSHHPAAPWLVP